MESIAPRFEVVSGQVTHPLRPGIMGQVARWPTGVYTLLAPNGHTHYTVPQAWAVVQAVFTPAPEVGPMSDPLAQLHTLPATERSGPLHYLEVNLVGLHWQLTERPSTTSELIIYSPTPALLAALHAATSSACHDGECPCFKAGEEVQRDPP